MALSCDPSADGGDSSGNFFPLSMLTTPNDASKVDIDGHPTPFYYQRKGGHNSTMYLPSCMTVTTPETNEEPSF